MDNATETQYSLHTKGVYKVYYKIKTKERINTKNKQTLKLSSKKNTAKQVLQYKSGSLSFANVEIHFKLAYYYRGVFYMEQARGVIDGVHFNTRELSFNDTKQHLNAERIVFTKQNKISITKQFSRLVPNDLVLQQ
ncbi:hypothetical protein [Moritella sp. PE36]|uniref:hypothetical protein n=1 Tax=Moritella sp. PE36 TaxID=58051 RepID=UPI0005C597CD|nr:hypothetical protein [Moritella sp. PE36]